MVRGPTITFKQDLIINFFPRFYGGLFTETILIYEFTLKRCFHTHDVWFPIRCTFFCFF